VGLFAAIKQATQRRETQAVIEGALTAVARSGLFDGDAAAAAQQVMSWTPVPSYVYTLNSYVMGALLLARYVVGSAQPREVLFPYSAACQSLISVASKPANDRPVLTQQDEKGIQAALIALTQFHSKTLGIPSVLDKIEAKQEVRYPYQDGNRQIVPVDDVPSSMMCILFEHSYLDGAYGSNEDWSIVSQELVEESWHSYDVIIVDVSGKGRQTIWFDITESKKRWTEDGNLADLAQVSAALGQVKKDR
jgi:hypothetical protein